MFTENFFFTSHFYGFLRLTKSNCHRPPPPVPWPAIPVHGWSRTHWHSSEFQSQFQAMRSKNGSVTISTEPRSMNANGLFLNIDTPTAPRILSGTPRKRRAPRIPIRIARTRLPERASILLSFIHHPFSRIPREEMRRVQPYRRVPVALQESM